MKLFNKKKLIIAIILVIVGIIYRLFLTDIPNVEPITAIALIAGSMLGGYYTFCIPLAIVVITDMYIGNNIIFLYTWSAWALMGWCGWLLRNRKKNIWKHSLELTGMSLFSSTFFFLWTNFGVWQAWKLYPKTWPGLISCYIAGLPFFRNNILSNLMIVFIFSVIFLSVWNYFPFLIKNSLQLKEKIKITLFK